MPYCLVIDLKKCVGCNACSTICKAENGTPPGVTRAKIMRKETGAYPHVRRLSIPMLCMQCQDPPCVKVCPSGATSRDERTGVVSVDKTVCVGCRACVMACPYGARYYRDSEAGYFGELTPYEKIMYAAMPRGVVDKCDFCLKNRVEKGLEPACVENCCANARFFGTREEMDALIIERNGYQFRAELGTDPSVFYLP